MPNPRHRLQSGLPGLWHGYLNLPRPLSIALAIGAFLFLINAFNGFHEVWFHWPLAPLLLVAVLWSVIGRR